MADQEFVDFSELDELVADLRGVPFESGENLRKAVEVSARNVRDSWREKLHGSRSVPRGPRSVTYDMTANESYLRQALLGNAGASEVVAEIGPEIGVPGGQGAIVGMLEYGTPTTAPRGFGLESLRENEEDFERGVRMAVDAAMERRDL